jgi:hypothetical protein
MTEKLTRFNTIINNIEFKMLRKDDNCWIKVIPLVRTSTPSNLHIILNDEYHHWDIYDENGREAHEIYFEGVGITPSYIKENCNCNSSQASCWAKAVFYTSRPDKSPFDEM